MVRAIRRCIPAAVCLTFLVACLLGCAGTTSVPLRYTAQGAAAGGCDCSLRLEPFEDARGQVQGLGRNREGRRYYPDRLVEDWVGEALASELAAAGCEVIRPNGGGSADFAIRGRIEEVRLMQRSAAEFEAGLSVTLRIAKDGRVVHTETFKAEVQRTAFPRSDVAARLMEETLGDLLEVMAPTVLEVCGQTGQTG